MKMKTMFVFSTVALFLLALTGCNADDNPSQSSATPTTQNQAATGSQAEPAPPIGNQPPANLTAEPEDLFTHIFDPELGGLRITQYHGELTQVMLPDEIMGVHIVAIDSGAFDMFNVTDVFFPDTVQYFGWGGRLYVDADEVLPDSWAIPYGVTHLYRVYVRVGRNSLSVGANIRTLDIPPTVQYIGESAFQGFSSLTSLTIPYGVTRINRQTFHNTPSLLVINFPPTIEYIASDSELESTSWWEAQPDGVVYVGGVAYRWKGDIPINTTLEIREGTIILPQGLFYLFPDMIETGRRNLIGITLPDSLVKIGPSEGQWGTFYGTSLSSVVIPDNVTYIGRSSFGNTPLTSVIIGNNVMYIGISAFSDTSLTSVTIPDSVTHIGRWAFANTQITSVSVPYTTIIESEAFDDGVQIERR